jgi:SAM-dependent methyltransferase
MSDQASTSQALPQWVPRFFGSLYASADMPWPQEKKLHTSQALMDLLQIAPGHVVLDQCCGEGHLALALAQRGLRVHAVDQSADYIARANSMKTSEDAHFTAADASVWHPGESVDASINWHTSLGYGGVAGAQAMIHALRAPLRPGKLWLLELRNLAHYKQSHPLDFSEVATVPQWGEVVVERSGQWQGNDLIQHWKMLRGDEIVWEQSDTRCWHPSVEELLSLIDEVGDECVGMYADIDRAPLDEDSPRMVVVVRKSA